KRGEGGRCMRLLWWRRGCNGGVRLAADGDGGDGGVVETMVMLMVAVEMGLRR
ncbi:hypothetical protein Tco_1289537, partial [Tanacetum coccineum]